MRLMGDPEMTIHLGGPESEEKIRDRHRRYCELDPADKGQMFAIVVEQGMVAVGSVGYWEREWHGEIVWETGWSVLPEYQGHGIASKATILVIEKARENGAHRYIHAFPKVDNAPSNAICRKAGFTFLGEVGFEYPPGHPIRCNDWRIDLFADPGD
jgi:RimJ/RimL family protein N-acetyltransferase